MSFPRASSWPVLAVVSVVLLVVLGISQLSFGRPLLRALGLTSDVGSYTTLAFQNPQNLPVRMKNARTTLNVGFTITNATAAAHNYAWTLSVRQGKSVRRPDSGTAYVAPGEKTLIAKTIEIRCLNEQVQVVISLANPTEHIDALMTCST